MQTQREFLKRFAATPMRPSELVANPFNYEGKVVAVMASFNSMQARDTALMMTAGEPIVVSRIPVGTFTTRAAIVVAGRVEGKVETRLPMLGIVSVPHLRFEGLHMCRDERCSEIVP